MRKRSKHGPYVASPLIQGSEGVTTRGRTRGSWEAVGRVRGGAEGTALASAPTAPRRTAGRAILAALGALDPNANMGLSMDRIAVRANNTDISIARSGHSIRHAGQHKPKSR